MAPRRIPPVPRLPTLLLALALMAALGAAGVFGWRLGHLPPAATAPAPAGWMTPRYLAHAWGLPPEALAPVLGQPQDGSGRRRSLAQIAADRAIPLPDLLADLTTLLEAER